MIWKDKGYYIVRDIRPIDLSLKDKSFSYDLYVEDNQIYLHKSLIYRLNSEQLDLLQIPEVALFDIVVDLTASNGYCLLCYDEYSEGNGTILYAEITKSILNLVSLKSQYLLPESIAANFDNIVNSISVLNSYYLQNIRHDIEWFEALSYLQHITASTPLLLHSSLLDQTIEIPRDVKIDVVESEIGPSTFSLKPYIQSDKVGKISIDLDSPINTVQLSINRHVRKSKNDLRIVINKQIKEDLTKLKNKSSISISKGTNEKEFLSDPNAFLNVSSIDFSSLSDRVIEIGQYNPQYYSFLIPGSRGKWIPNIQLENSVSGAKTNIQIETLSGLQKLKDTIQSGKTNGDAVIIWNGTDIPIKVAENLVPKFENAFKKAKELPTDSFPKEKSQTLVLVIHENAIDLEYSESADHGIPLSSKNIDFKFFELSNLVNGIQLKNHQIKGVASIQYLLNNRLDYKGVLLADDMGLGKTIQVLYVIEYYFQRIENSLPCLIVAPVSLLKNWNEEYLKFFHPSVKVKVIRGGDIPKGNHNIPEVLNDLRRPQLILTNYETFRDAQLTFGQVDFGLVAIDEAQRIKTPGTMITSAIKAVKADFKIAMTGTPVENTMVDLWSIIDFIQPGLFQSAKTFHSIYQKPMENSSFDHGSIVAKLRDIIGIQFIRRLKKDVAQDLPTKKLHKINCPLTTTQVEYYNKIIQDYHALNSNNALAFIHKLKLLCDCPLLLDFNLSELTVEQLVSSTARLKELKLILDKISSKFEKVIIFTEYRKTQEMLQKVVRVWFDGYNPKIINGSTATEDTRTQLSRQSIIDDFQDASGFGVIIMSPIAAGVGLNVTAANHVVHYSRHWNPAKESQATDRAYRIGQSKDVHVYYLLSIHNDFDTFDVILADLLKKKERLSDTTMYPSTIIEVKESEIVSAFPFKQITGHSFMKEYTYDDIIKFEPLLFEAAIGAIYLKSQNYTVFLTPRIGDKGADLICFSENENLLVQVKQSKNKINADGLKDLEIAQLTYPRIYKKDFKSVLISNANLTKGAQEVLEDSNSEFLRVKKLMTLFDITSISYELILEIKNSRITSFK